MEENKKPDQEKPHPDHHAPELIRDPETGELVSSPAEFAANRKTQPLQVPVIREED